MGWFSSSTPETTTPPNRSERKKCWESRDLYNSCLDRIHVDNPFDKEKQGLINKECGKEDKQFAQDCAASWVKYFKEKRPFEIKKERLLKEAKQEGNEIVQLPGYRK